MQPINASCKKDYYPAYHTTGTRPLHDISLIVLHDQESSTAKSAAQYFLSPKSGGSAHICVDDQECYRCLPNTAVPWGAPHANYNGFHIEQAGFAKYSLVIWKSHINTIRRAAYKAAIHAKLFHIPVVFVDAAGLKARKSGITTHREVSKAFGGTHTDPGPLYPIPLFMYLCKKYRNQLG